MAEPKELALLHFEKGILLIAVGVLAYTGATSLSPPKELKATKQIDNQRKTIERHMTWGRTVRIASSCSLF